MSTNPFRRSSLKVSGSSSSTPVNIPAADVRGTSPDPLSVDTKVANISQKHVNFASPPADFISPVSYPPSPEFTRQEFLASLLTPKSPLPEPTDYIEALRSDPFAAEASDGEDEVIGEAIENAKTNATIDVHTAEPPKPPREDAVKETLGRFASGPRKPGNSQQATRGGDPAGPSKAVMDVDAFKRLLLTGEHTPSAGRPGLGQNIVQSSSGAAQAVSDSSSSADTASISQHSIFEAIPPAREESPRTSTEIDEPRPSTTTTPESKKVPPPPKSRRGKPIRDTQTDPTLAPIPGPPLQGAPESASRTVSASSEASGFVSSTTEQTPVAEGQGNISTSEGQKKIPPAPPLTRRQSQKPPVKPILTRSSSSRYSVFSTDDGPISPPLPTPGMKAPPPPPSRRTTSSGESRPSFATTSLIENAQPTGDRLLPENPDIDVRPTQIESSTTSIKRLSFPAAPPPVPPPRRGRGSSRSSVETSRPSMAALGVNEAEGRAPGTTRKQSIDEEHNLDTSLDILADLEALKREVDAYRASAGR